MYCGLKLPLFQKEKVNTQYSSEDTFTGLEQAEWDREKNTRFIPSVTLLREALKQKMVERVRLNGIFFAVLKLPIEILSYLPFFLRHFHLEEELASEVMKEKEENQLPIQTLLFPLMNLLSVFVQRTGAFDCSDVSLTTRLQVYLLLREIVSKPFQPKIHIHFHIQLSSFLDTLISIYLLSLCWFSFGSKSWN